jgi:hypothetical protein
MLRLVYVLGSAYVLLCASVVWLRPTADVEYVETVAHAPRDLPQVVGGDSWFGRMKPYCNAVEVETRTRSDPPPETTEGLGYSAACYALAGRIDSARAAITRLPEAQRSRAASIVFNVGHPVADAGDDKSAGPMMSLVVEFWPDNYMALYHAGMSNYIIGEPGQARGQLRRFLELYSPDDGWRRNATHVLSRIESGHGPE